MIETEEIHRTDAIALTPVSLMSLRRPDFCQLIHQYPILILRVLEFQDIRLRQQRIQDCHCY